MVVYTPLLPQETWRLRPVRINRDVKQDRTLMCLYGGGFLSFFLSSWSCRSSFSACSSRNRTAASSKAEEREHRSDTRVIAAGTNTTDSTGYLSCRWRRRLSPSSPCCWRPRPYKGRPWPGTSTGNRWSRRSERETPRHRASSAGCSPGSFWDGWPPPATTFMEQERGNTHRSLSFTRRKLKSLNAFWEWWESHLFCRYLVKKKLSIGHIQILTWWWRRMKKNRSNNSSTWRERECLNQISC